MLAAGTDDNYEIEGVTSKRDLNDMDLQHGRYVTISWRGSYLRPVYKVNQFYTTSKKILSIEFWTMEMQEWAFS